MTDPTSREEVGRRLRAIRKVLGFEQPHGKKKQFAELLGVPEPTVARWIDGGSYPKPEAIYVLEKLGIGFGFPYTGDFTAVKDEKLRDALVTELRQKRSSRTIRKPRAKP